MCPRARRSVICGSLAGLAVPSSEQRIRIASEAADRVKPDALNELELPLDVGTQSHEQETAAHFTGLRLRLVRIGSGGACW
jgi:hypothetical protein